MQLGDLLVTLCLFCLFQTEVGPYTYRAYYENFDVWTNWAGEMRYKVCMGPCFLAVLSHEAYTVVHGHWLLIVGCARPHTAVRI